MASPEEFERAGLFDPMADAGTDRIQLLEWLEARGHSLAEMIEAHERGALGGLAGDTTLVAGERLTRAESVRRSNLTPERFDDIANAFGFAPAGRLRDEVGMVASEVDAIASFGALAEMFSEDEGLGFVRVVGSAMARVAEAAVSMFLIDVESSLVASETGELEMAQKVVDAVSLLDGFVPVLDPVLRRHLKQAIDRSRLTMIDELERFRYRYAVGFVDLVGFTPISQSMTASELGRFIRNFEARAHDAVTASGARLVKLIGDEVMFVAPTADLACEVARALMSEFATEAGGTIEPRGGLAFGDVVVRGGDYYGEIVNLAARLVAEAQPSELLVSEAFAAATDRIAFAPAGRRALKGFAELVAVSAHSF